MRPVEFGEAVPATTRLTLFSEDKPDHFFTVTNFWMDETSGIALALKTGLPPAKSKTRKAEFIYSFTCQARKRMKTAGASGGPIRQDLILVSGPINSMVFVAIKMGRRQGTRSGAIIGLVTAVAPSSFIISRRRHNLLTENSVLIIW